MSSAITRSSATFSSPSRRRASSDSDLPAPVSPMSSTLAGRPVAQGDVHEGAVEGHAPTAHDRQVVQREDHLLEVAEVAEALLERHGGDEQPGGRVVEEDRGHLAEARQRLGRRPEDVDGIGAGRYLVVRGDLEEVGQRQAEAEKELVHEDEHDQRTDDRRIADPPAAVELHSGQWILAHLQEPARARVHRRVQQTAADT